MPTQNGRDGLENNVAALLSAIVVEWTDCEKRYCAILY